MFFSPQGQAAVDTAVAAAAVFGAAVAALVLVVERDDGMLLRERPPPSTKKRLEKSNPAPCKVNKEEMPIIQCWECGQGIEINTTPFSTFTSISGSEIPTELFKLVTNAKVTLSLRVKASCKRDIFKSFSFIVSLAKIYGKRVCFCDFFHH